MVMLGLNSGTVMVDLRERWMIPFTLDASTLHARTDVLLTMMLHEARMVMDLSMASEGQGTLTMACVEA